MKKITIGMPLDLIRTVVNVAVEKFISVVVAKSVGKLGKPGSEIAT